MPQVRFDGFAVLLLATDARQFHVEQAANGEIIGFDEQLLEELAGFVRLHQIARHTDRRRRAGLLVQGDFGGTHRRFLTPRHQFAVAQFDFQTTQFTVDFARLADGSRRRTAGLARSTLLRCMSGIAVYVLMIGMVVVAVVVVVVVVISMAVIGMVLVGMVLVGMVLIGMTACRLLDDVFR